jgi:hypothetical protein
MLRRIMNYHWEQKWKNPSIYLPEKSTLFTSLYDEVPDSPVTQVSDYCHISDDFWLTRLRLECVPLNSYLFSRRLSNAPHCDCGELSEDVEHFLLDCSIHADIRSKFLSRNLLLWNSRKENMQRLLTTFSSDIIKDVCDFVKHTKRFK